VYGSPWLLPAIAHLEDLGGRGGPTVGFRLLRMAYQNMTAELGLAVLGAGLGFVDLGEAQKAWHIRDKIALEKLENLIADDGPGGDDPGRQFVLEVRQMGGLPDTQMRAYLLMLHPSLTPSQLEYAMRP
jgi:hypothetical protein